MSFESWLWAVQQAAEKIDMDFNDLTETMGGNDNWESLFQEGLTPEEALELTLNQ